MLQFYTKIFISQQNSVTAILVVAEVFTALIKVATVVVFYL